MSVPHSELVKAALGALARSYSPYSKFKVGAALETKSGKIFAGCNVENASFGLAICAERSAAIAAVSAGERDFVRVVIVTSNARPTPPCGACRQFLKEFSPKMEIIMVGRSRMNKAVLEKLLPTPFDKGWLE